MITAFTVKAVLVARFINQKGVSEGRLELELPKASLTFAEQFFRLLRLSPATGRDIALAYFQLRTDLLASYVSLPSERVRCRQVMVPVVYASECVPVGPCH